MTTVIVKEGPDPYGHGIGGWLSHVGNVVFGLPDSYRRELALHRGRTIALTIMTIILVTYPILNNLFLSSFSRNVFPLPLPDDTVVTFMMIFGIMAIGLNIVAGFAGLLDLGYVAFYAIGAYTAAFLASPHWGSISVIVLANVPPGFPGIHLPFWIIVPIAIVVAGTFRALLGAPTLRLRGDYLAIVTLGFGEIVPVVFRNLADVTYHLSLGPIEINVEHVNLTGGPLGINPIDAPFLPGANIVFNAGAGYAPVYLGMFLLVIAILFARNLERSRIGRAWMAIREDELAAEMMGVNTLRTKLLAFALGASFAGVAGSLQASYLGATTSDFFQFSTSILVLIMIIIGGIGNIWGVLLGAIALTYVDKTFLPYVGEQLAKIAPSLPNPAQFNFLFFGLILVAMMRFRPEGFLPNRQRAAELAGAHTQAEIEAHVDEVVAVEEAAEVEAAQADEASVVVEPSATPPGQAGAADDGRSAESTEERRDQ
jgi:branched-chain amino acid transport system permease protein